MRFPEPPLLLITDRRQSRRPLGQVVADAIAAGCRWISVREKDLSDDDQVALLRALLPIARCTVTPHQQKRQTPRVHLSARSDPIAARNLLGADKLIGVSIHTVTESEAIDTAVVERTSVSAAGSPLSAKSGRVAFVVIVSPLGRL